jgi:hypothetical protein
MPKKKLLIAYEASSTFSFKWKPAASPTATPPLNLDLRG